MMNDGTSEIVARVRDKHRKKNKAQIFKCWVEIIMLTSSMVSPWIRFIRNVFVIKAFKEEKPTIEITIGNVVVRGWLLQARGQRAVPK